MTTNEDIKLVSPCGIYCGDCAVYRVKDNPALIPALLSNGLTEDQFPCPGCRAVEGMCPHLEGRCENFICATNHEVQMCFECGEFPCEKLHPAADRANSLPHNMKMYQAVRCESLDRASAPDQAALFHGQDILRKGTTTTRRRLIPSV